MTALVTVWQVFSRIVGEKSQMPQHREVACNPSVEVDHEVNRLSPGVGPFPPSQQSHESAKG